MIPKRPFWLAAGAAIGAGSSLWIERRIRRTVHEAVNRLQPDALAVEIGKSARQIAESTSERLRGAVAVGRDEMRQHEEQLWQDLSERRIAPNRAAPAEDDGWPGGSLPDPSVTGRLQPEGSGPGPKPATGSTGRRGRRQRVAATKSPSHLGN